MRAHIDHLRAWTATAGEKVDIPAAESPRQRILPAYGVPAVSPLTLPVVIAGDEKALGASLTDRGDLRRQPELGVDPIRIPCRRNAFGVDVVAQEDHEPVKVSERVGLPGEFLQYRLGVVGLAPRVADEKEGELQAVLGGW